MASSILLQAAEQGVFLYLKEGQLAFKSKPGCLTPQLRALIKDNKEEIIALLMSQAALSERVEEIERAPEGMSLPLSYSQQRLWLLDSIEGGSHHYNIPISLRLRGSLDYKAFEKTFMTIIARHESLRSVYLFDEGNEPTQIVKENFQFKVQLNDLSELDSELQEIEVKERTASEAVDIFNLNSDLMLRVQLLKLSDEDHIVLATMHHIASDGWSMGLLVNEFSALYSAYVKGNNNPLPDLEIQYRDYAYWQRNWLQGEVLEKQLVYWEKQLDGLPIVHSLPLDFERPKQQSFQGNMFSIHIDSQRYHAFNDMCKGVGASFFMGLHAVFSVLLSRHSNETDIVMGTAIANRKQSEIESLIGFFMNTLVLRSDLSKAPCFIDLLVQSKQMLLDAYAYQQVPFEQVVERLQPERSLSHSPLFQILLLLQSNEQGTLSLPGLTLKPVEQENQIAKFDLTLSVTEMDSGLDLCWEYNKDLFSEQTIKTMAEHFSLLFSSFIESPNESVFSVPMLKEEEKCQLLTGFNNPEVSTVSEKCIHELFEQQVVLAPEKIALVFEEQVLTYLELNQRANKLAHYLIDQRGVTPESLVGVCLDRSLEMVIAIIGILKAGGAYVPLDPKFPVARLQHMIEDGNLNTVISKNDIIENITLKEQYKVCLDSDEVEKYIALASISNPNIYALTSSCLAYVIYTSGSTGVPKGVMVEHHSVVNLLSSMAKQPGITQSDTLLAVTSTSFDIHALELFLPLLNGAITLLASSSESQEPDLLVKLISDHSVSIMQATPATWKILVDGNWLPNSKIKALCGGEALTQTLADNLLSLKNVELWNMYGPTETTIWSCVQKIENTQKPISIGSGIKNTQLFVVENGKQLAPIGTPGELFIGGTGLARGYINQEVLTKEHFIEDPFNQYLDGNTCARVYKTGDLVRWLPDGTLECLGRVDQQIKLRGFRIELGEIEHALISHVRVEDAVVAIKESPSGEKRLNAYIVEKEKHSVKTKLESELGFSLFYFGADNSTQGNKYDLYLSAAKFADKNGFEAIWTPERHFNPVGALYPNPSVLNAALATITNNIHLRAGSVVLPLHEPLRIAEEWSVVDNISQGRVGIAAASGWHNIDFVFNPAHYEDRKRVMSEGIKELQSLWRGEKVLRQDGNLNEVAVEIYPKPVQAELPLWTTSPGNPATFVEAGKLGTNVLTHLLGQTIEELAEKIELYRKSLARHGHDPSSGRVTLMIHAFVGDDLQEVMDKARGPFIDYMNAHLSLMIPWLQSMGVDTDTVGENDLESIASFAFERYVNTASLIGTPESTVKVAQRLKEIGVDEIACLIDWMDNVNAKAGLESLAKLKNLSAVSSNSTKVFTDSVRQNLFKTLPEYMHPNAYMVLDKLPLTPNGKIDRKALPQIDISALQGEYVAPKTHIESVLVNICSELLNIDEDKISITANFFDLGGHSLLATLLMTRIREELNIDIPLRDVFKAPVLSQLAKIISECDVNTKNHEITKVSREQSLPLSYSQQRLWLVDQMEGNSEQYNTLYPMRFTGQLDIEAVQYSFNKIIQRHTSLKTTFIKNEEGDPIQVVQDDAQLLINKFDLSALDKDEQVNKISKLYSNELLTSFDLATELMIRVSLMKLSNTEHVIVINIHHIAFDGWSLGILIREFSELYNAFVLDEKPMLPVLDVEYADYAYWQKEYLSGDGYKELSQYWSKHLEGAPELLVLPTDNPRPKIRSNEGATEILTLPKATVEKLNKYCIKSESTIFMTMLAGLKILMMAYSGQNDIVIGTSVANRRHKNIESLIGFFVNILPIRTKIDPEISLSTLVQQVKEISLSAFDHQDMPFDLLVEEVNPQRNAAYNPIYQVLFVVQNNAKANMQLHDVNVSFEDVSGEGEGFAKFDLSMTVQESADDMSVFLEYNRSLFKQQKVMRMLEDYKSIINLLIEQDDMIVNHLVEKLNVNFDRPALSFHHIGIACDDIQQSSKLIENLFEVSSKSDLIWDENQQANLCLFETNHGVQLELVQGPQVANLRERNKAFYHICYATPNIQSALLYFESLGASVMSEPTPAPLFSGQLVAFVDTDLGVIELLQSSYAHKDNNETNTDLLFMGVGTVVKDFETAIWQYNTLHQSNSSQQAIVDGLFSGKVQSMSGTLCGSKAMDIQLLEAQSWHQVSDIGLSHFCFEVSDLTKALQHFVAAGCTIHKPAVPSDSFGQRLAIIIDTPFGYVLLLEKELKPVTEERVNTLGVQIEKNVGVNLVISGTFTLEPLETTLLYWAERLNNPLNLIFTAFNQPFQQLLDPNSETNKNITGINIFIIRLEDWLGKDGNASEILQQNTNDYINNLKAICERLDSQFIVQICPLANNDENLIKESQEIELRLVALSNDLPNLNVLTSLELFDRYQVEDYYDEYMGLLGGKYFTDPMYTAIGTNIYRAIHLKEKPPTKVIVLDCDNTLWSGVCGEVGPLAVKVTKPFKMLQRFMLEQYEKGVVLCLNSKNNYEDVLAVFEQHPDMILSMEHIVCAKVNWSAKSKNIREIAVELNLNCDSFIFIDDDDVQCAEVRINCPEVTVLQLPKKVDDFPVFLNNTWAFDTKAKVSVGEERTEYYKSNVKRQQLQQHTIDIQSFLENLELKIDIRPILGADIPRASEMSLRTNQFNLTTIRYQENELKSELVNKQAWIVNVSDRFGEYGDVGVMIAEVRNNKLKVTDFMLSCRAMGREVEYKMVRFLGEYAKGNNLLSVEIYYRQSPKNLPALNFMSTLPAYNDGDFRVRSTVEMTIDKALNASGENKLAAPAEVVKSTKVEEVKPTLKNIDYESVALATLDIDKLCEEIEKQGSVEELVDRQFANYVAPSTDIEKELCQIWQDLLGVERVGIYDHFIKLGGHSLLMLKLLSKLKVKFDITLQFKDIHDCMVLVDMARKAQESVIFNANKELGDNAQNLEEIEW